MFPIASDVTARLRAEALKAAGYRTGHLGKWHLGDDPKTQGFDINIGKYASGGPNGGYFSPFPKGPMAAFNDAYPKNTHRRQQSKQADESSGGEVMVVREDLIDSKPSHHDKRDMVDDTRLRVFV